MQEHRIRPATMADATFLAEAILGAEKSNTDKAGLATLFDLRDEQVLELIVRMFDEEVDGCDYSISSFLVAEAIEGPVAAVAGWVEAHDDELPSHQLRSNLFGYVFPPESIVAFQKKKDLVAPLQIEREPHTLQIEHVYVRPGHRGHSLAGRLILEHIARSLVHVPALNKAQVQLVANNTTALKLYEKLGFQLVKTYRATDPKVLDLLPDTVRLLLEKDLNRSTI